MNASKEASGDRRGTSRQRRGERRLLSPSAMLSAIVVAALIMVGLPQPALAFEIPTTAWVSNATTGTVTTPSGVVVTVTGTGNVGNNGTATAGARGWDASQYSPTLVTGDSVTAPLVNTASCPSTGVCPGLGTLTIAFSQPVQNPILHLSGIGGVTTSIDGAGARFQSDLHAILDLATAGASLTKVAGNTQFSVTPTRVTATNDSTSPNCTTNANTGNSGPAAATAACGSVQVNGTVSSVVFNVSASFVQNPTAVGPNNGAGSGDAFGITVTLPQDFGDAPATYNPTQAPAHIIGDLRLGTVIPDADNPTVRNSTTSPFAGPAANGDNLNNTNDEDAFASSPPTVLAGFANTYTATVPISGGSKTTYVCGYIDFNKGGTFDTGAERACATAAAGATSVTLSWSVPAATTAGTSFARFRAGYTQSQVQSPTGLADSGEVEDYPITFANRPTIVLNKVTQTTAGGPFGFTLTNTTQTTGTVTTTAAGTPTQVDGDSAAGIQPFTVAAVNTAVTINESSLPAGWATSGAVCTNAGGTTIGTLSGRTYTLPASEMTPGAAITCTYTNGVPSVSLTKVGSVPTGAAAGSVVTYTFTATNTGPQTLTGVAITDPKPGLSALTYGTWQSGTVGTLTPGQSVTATATYTLTQADVNTGTVNNTATVNGTGPDGTAVTASAPATVTIPARPGIAIDKTGVLSGPSAAGSVVTYTFIVTNTGNLPLTGVTVTDPLPGLSAISYGTWPSGTSGLLQPGQSVTATATKTLTQADVNAGSIANTASTTGTPPRGTPPTANHSATVPLTRTPAIDIVKSGSLAGPGVAGNIVTYTFIVRNTGNVTLTGVGITDPLPGLSAISFGTWPGAVGTLLPNQTVTATATYALTQANVDAGKVDNTATTTGTPPVGGPVTDTGPATVTIAPRPAIDLNKTGVRSGSGVAGDIITYTFVAQNTGNVTLNGVTITDPLPGLSTLSYGTWPSGVTGRLLPNQTITATATYTLTQADVNAGSVVNTATTTGTPPTGPAVSHSDPETVLIPSGPAIDLIKTGVAAGTSAGSTVTYTFEVRNTGNVTLTGVGVTDPMSGLSALTFGTWPGATGTLQPGQMVKATATYQLTQSDVNAGRVDNTATASGTPPSGPAVTHTDPETVLLPAAPAIDLVKTGSLAGTGVAGDTVTYTFTVRNTGNVTLTSVGVSDPLPGLSGLTFGTWPGATGTLQPNQQVTATATYQLTQANVNAGRVDNTATAAGTPPSGPAVTDPGSKTIPITASPSIDLTKNGVAAGSTAGSVVTYTFTVRNTGNVTLTGVGVTDPLPGLSAITFGAWPGVAGTLQPNQEVTATATYALTQADVDAGSVVNTATSTGTPPTGPPVTDPAGKTVPITASPSIDLDKTGVAAGSTAGSVVTYTFTVRNTGNVTLTGVGVTDPLPGLSAITFGTWPGATGTLAPNQQVTATATRALTQADVDAGSVVNTATSTGTPPTGPAVTHSDPATVVIPTGPAIDLDKTGVAAGSTAGSVVTYTFVVRNTGNVTLTSVGVTDPLPGLSAITFGTWPGTAGTLAPNQQVTATATYSLTQADVNAGSVVNTATATGTPPTGPAVTDPGSKTIPITASPSIDLTKNGVAAGSTVGSVVTYTFTVRNTGNVTLTGVGVTDPLPGLSAITFGTWPGATGTLQPNQEVTATATYALTQADVDAGSVVNTATSTGTPPTGPPVTDPAGKTVPIPASPSIDLTKNGVAAGSTAGSVVTYTFTVRNTGNVTLTGVGVTDPLPGLSAITFGTWPGVTGTLAPNQQVTATATYALTQADVNAGSVVNTATATGTPPTGPAVTDPGSKTIPITASPSIDLDKTGVAAGSTAGSLVTYTFVVRNTGNVTLTGVGVTDPLPGLSAITFGTWPGATGTLQPNQQVTATATYALTQADVNAGSVVNTATSTATPPTGPAVTHTDPATVPVPSGAAIELTKSGAAAGSTAGSVVTYTFIVRNTGNVTLTGVGVTDPLPGLSAITFGTWPGATGTLQPNQQVTATATYSLTQADVDAGSIANTATSTGTPPTGPAVTDPDSKTIPITASPSIDLTKNGVAAGSTAGSLVTYTFVVRNTGNVTLTGVGVTDPLPGLSAITFGTWPGATGTLAPNQQVTATATYALTQADVDAGSVVNTATSTGTPPTGPAVTDPAGKTVPIPASPSIDLTKNGVAAGSTAGSVVTYTFVVRNTGNVTLTGVGITDPLPGLSAITFGTWPGATGTLAPNQQVTATATYSLTQADVNAGSIVNIATSTGTPPTGPAVTDPAGKTIPLTASPSIDLTKTGVAAGSTAGSVVTYTFVVRNTGNVTLTGVGITDPLPGLSAITFGTWPGATGTLQPNQQVTATATYALTQADVDAGSVVNTATSTGTPPTGPAVTDPDTKTIPIVASPSIDLTKDGVAAGSAAGSVVTYTFVVRNTGNVTLTGVGITDPLPGLSAITFGTWPGATGTLQPNQQVTATATYALTQADVDAGSVVNTATSTGTPPTGPAVTDPDSKTIPITASPSIDLTKNGVAAGSTAGSLVTYTFVVRNTGNVTLTGVGVTDPLPGLSAITFGTWPGATGTLAPNQQVTATATYSLTQADVDAGSVVNTATSTGTPPTGPPVTDPAGKTVPIPASPSIDLTKNGVAAGSTAGSVVTYTFLVRNTGNVTLTGVGITDPLPGLSAITFGTWPGVTGTLAPNQQVTATATYALTQADVDAGSVVNTATSTGTPPTGPAVTDPAGKTVPIPASPSIDLDKSGVAAGSTAGSVVTYTFIVRNTGNVTLTGVGVTDPLPGLSAITFGTWPGATGTLAPTESVTATATYTLTQADVNAGSVVNIATSSGTPPTGPAVTHTDPATVPVPSGAAIDLTKTGVAAGSTAGSVVTYTFVVRNTGNVTLTGVGVTDPLPGLSAITFTSWPGAAGTLQPSQSVTGTATYSLTQADVDAGSIANTATSTGTPPTGPAVTDPDSKTIPITASPSIELTKNGVAAGSTVGSVVTYTFTVRNTGNVTLTGVGVTDPLPGLSAITFGTWPGATGTLQPNQEVTATATYSLTQADVDAGSVVNTATSTGTPPTGPPVTDPAGKTVPIPASPSIELTKNGVAAGSTAGSVVTYTFTVRNTGNVTLTGVGVTDPLPGLSAITFGTWPGVTGTLAPNQQVTATATYPLTQADVDAGSVANTATSTGTPPTGPPVTDPAGKTIPITALPAIELTKNGVAAGSTAGSLVTYTFTVRNTGNVTLTGVGVTDPLPGLSAITFGTWPGATGTLAPNQQVTATATYSLTQADVNAGSVVNTATAAGTPPTGPAVTNPGSKTIPIVASPSIDLDKTGVAAGSIAGSVVTYTFVVRNTGNVTLTGVGVTDPLPGLSAITFGTWPGTAGTLAPNQQVTATATYSLTQADVNAGSVVNTATSTGTPPTGPAVTHTDPATVPVPSGPAIALTKTGVAAGATAGSLVTYTFVVRNTGNVTLTGVGVTDPLPGLSAITFGTWPGATGTLQPNEQVTATATYALTQADVDAGSVVNTATSTGTPPTGPAVTDPDTKTIPIVASPSIDLNKTGAAGGATAGSTVTYTFVVRNTGNVTLTGVGVTDPMPGLSAITFGTWPGATGTLAPNESVTATATYTVTQADVDAGSIVNTATTAGTPPTGPAVTHTDPATVSLAQNPAIELVKVGALGGTGVVGDTITYTFTATNTGNETLEGVAIADPLPGLSALVYGAWPGADGTLAPGQRIIATATYVLTQADVDAGKVTNTATVSGHDLSGVVVNDTSSARVPTSPAPAISLTKQAHTNGKGQVGDVITYTMVATNTGNVTLTGVTIADPLAGLSPLTYSWPGAANVLAPGQSVKATATLVLTTAQVAAGRVVNTAKVSAVSAGGTTVDAAASVTATTGSLPSTGGTFQPALPLGGLLIIIAGAWLMLTASRRKENA